MGVTPQLSPIIHVHRIFDEPAIGVPAWKSSSWLLIATGSTWLQAMDACGIQQGVQAGSWRWKYSVDSKMAFRLKYSRVFMRTWYHRLDLRYCNVFNQWFDMVWPVPILQQYTISHSWWFANRRVPSNPAPLLSFTCGLCAGVSLTMFDQCIPSSYHQLPTSLLVSYLYFYCRDARY